MFSQLWMRVELRSLMLPSRLSRFWGGRNRIEIVSMGRLRLMTLYRIEGRGGPVYQVFVEMEKRGTYILGHTLNNNTISRDLLLGADSRRSDISTRYRKCPSDGRLTHVYCPSSLSPSSLPHLHLYPLTDEDLQIHPPTHLHHLNHPQ